MRQRYDEYTQVNGATANRLMDEVEKLEKIRDAAIELLDGFHADGLESITGIEERECQRLLNIIRGES